jgi:hypothetical protein
VNFAWHEQAKDQLEWYWKNFFRPRLEGLTDHEYSRWRDGLAALSPEDFSAPCRPAEDAHASDPFGTLFLHINREVFHHAAEVALLRDLYRCRDTWRP